MIIFRPIHFAANGITPFIYSFLWMNNIPVCVCVCVCVYLIFNYSSIDGHLGFFYVLAIVNSAAMNFEVHVFFEYGFLCPGVGLMDHMVVLLLVF